MGAHSRSVALHIALNRSTTSAKHPWMFVLFEISKVFGMVERTRGARSRARRRVEVHGVFHGVFLNDWERKRETKETRETRAPTRARDERDERLRLPLKKGGDNIRTRVSEPRSLHHKNQHSKPVVFTVRIYDENPSLNLTFTLDLLLFWQITKCRKQVHTVCYWHGLRQYTENDDEETSRNRKRGVLDFSIKSKC